MTANQRRAMLANLTMQQKKNLYDSLQANFPNIPSLLEALCCTGGLEGVQETFDVILTACATRTSHPETDIRKLFGK